MVLVSAENITKQKNVISTLILSLWRLMVVRLVSCYIIRIILN